MSDVIDRACEREEEMRRDALAEQARRAATVAGDSALVCIECDTEIPEGRRIAIPGTQLCVECQRLRERKWQ